MTARWVRDYTPKYWRRCVGRLIRKGHFREAVLYYAALIQAIRIEGQL